MRLLSALFEALGLIGITVGAALFDVRAGLIVLSSVLILLGFVVDPPERRTE